MSTRDTTTDATEEATGASRTPEAAAEAGAEPPDPAADAPLAATVVNYVGEPDRRTVYPPGASSVSRMSTWLTADADAFLDLEEMR